MNDFEDVESIRLLPMKTPNRWALIIDDKPAGVCDLGIDPPKIQTLQDLAPTLMDRIHALIERIKEGDKTK